MIRVAGRWANVDRARGQMGVHTQTRPCGEDGAVGRRVAGRWASIDHALVARGWTRRVDPMHAGPNLGWQVRVGRGAGMLALIWAVILCETLQNASPNLGCNFM